jgi:hypothetical protein
MSKLIIQSLNEDNGNPFVQDIDYTARGIFRKFPFSGQSYHRNDELMRWTVDQVAQIIGIKKGDRTLDLGYGENLHVAGTMASIGASAYAVDPVHGRDFERFPNDSLVPAHFVGEEDYIVRGASQGNSAITANVRRYAGNIADVFDSDSELAQEKFDLISLWGTLESGRDHIVFDDTCFWVDKAMAELEKRLGTDFRSAIYASVEDTKVTALNTYVDVLNPGGGILVVSPRFAYDEVGFDYDRLPQEKRMNLWLIDQLVSNGANELTLIGLTKKQVLELDQYDGIARQLGDVDLLFKSDTETTYTEPSYDNDFIERVRGMNLPLGRIDAVYAKFYKNQSNE